MNYLKETTGSHRGDSRAADESEGLHSRATSMGLEMTRSTNTSQAKSQIKMTAEQFLQWEVQDKLMKTNNEFVCQHFTSRSLAMLTSRLKKTNIKISDAHLTNCNICGAFFPRSGCLAIRSLKRRTEMSKMYSSDLLRSMYE